MNPWAINPSWQNFSTMFREAATAREARTEMERLHHLTASVYFGIASLEAFLNGKKRTALEGTRSEGEIFHILRKPNFREKFKDWPGELLKQKPINLKDQTLALIYEVNDIRGNLTHPKTRGHDVYAKLDTIDPASVICAIVELIVRFNESEGTDFPYWLFGWNYLNPRVASCEIIILNNQQFCFSLGALGFRRGKSGLSRPEDWPARYFRTFEGYLEVRGFLDSQDHCEPKFDVFPFRPTLCRHWWKSEHHESCGRSKAISLAEKKGRS